MEAEFTALNEKINQLIELSRRLRSENTALRQQIAKVGSENKNLAEKIIGAKSKLEIFLNQIPENE